MKIPMYLLAVVLSLCLPSAPSHAQESRWASADEPTVKHIVAMEAKWASSGCGLEPELGAAIADDFQGTAPSGQRYSKAKAISTDVNALARDCQLGAVKVHLFGDALAIAYGSESSVPKVKQGKDSKRCLVWTDTWIRRDAKWQMIAVQDGRVDCPKK